MGTPNLDAATLDFAETMVSSLELEDDAPDFLKSLYPDGLVVSRIWTSQRRAARQSLRLDRELDSSSTTLDSQVGKGR